MCYFRCLQAPHHWVTGMGRTKQHLAEEAINHLCHLSLWPPPFFTFALFGAKHTTRGTLPNLQGLCTRQRQNQRRYLSTPVTANCCSQENDCHKSYGHSHKAQHWGASGHKDSLLWGCQTTLDQLYAAVSFKCTYNGLITMCHLYTFSICTSPLHHLYFCYSVV